MRSMQDLLATDQETERGVSESSHCCPFVVAALPIGCSRMHACSHMYMPGCHPGDY